MPLGSMRLPFCPRRVAGRPPGRLPASFLLCLCVGRPPGQRFLTFLSTVGYLRLPLGSVLLSFCSRRGVWGAPLAQLPHPFSPGRGVQLPPGRLLAAMLALLGSGPPPCAACCGFRRAVGSWRAALGGVSLPFFPSAEGRPLARLVAALLPCVGVRHLTGRGIVAF